MLRQLAVDELSSEGAAELALQLLGRHFGTGSGGGQGDRQRVARQPLFRRRVGALRPHPELRHDGVRLDVDSTGMTLERLIITRLQQLEPDPTRLLELVAVAGQPIEMVTVLQAAELGSAAQAAITVLRAASWIRIRRSRAIDEIECYHDRIRDR